MNYCRKQIREARRRLAKTLFLTCLTNSTIVNNKSYNPLAVRQSRKLQDPKRSQKTPKTSIPTGARLLRRCCVDCT